MEKAAGNEHYVLRTYQHQTRCPSTQTGDIPTEEDRNLVQWPSFPCSQYMYKHKEEGKLPETYLCWVT